MTTPGLGKVGNRWELVAGSWELGTSSQVLRPREKSSGCVAYMPCPDLIDRNINISAYLDSARLGFPWALALALVAYVTVARIRSHWGCLGACVEGPDPGLGLVCHPDEQLVKLSVHGAKEPGTQCQDHGQRQRDTFIALIVTRILHPELVFVWLVLISRQL